MQNYKAVCLSGSQASAFYTPRSYLYMSSNATLIVCDENIDRSLHISQKYTNFQFINKSYLIQRSASECFMTTDASPLSWTGKKIKTQISLK